MDHSVCDRTRDEVAHGRCDIGGTAIVLTWGFDVALDNRDHPVSCAAMRIIRSKGLALVTNAYGWGRMRLSRLHVGAGGRDAAAEAKRSCGEWGEGGGVCG